MFGGRATTTLATTALVFAVLTGTATANPDCRHNGTCDHSHDHGGVLGIDLGVGLGTCDDLLKAVVAVEGQERTNHDRLDQDAADARAAHDALRANPDDSAAVQRAADADRRYEHDKTEENRLLALIVKLKAGECGHGTGRDCHCHPAPTTPPVTVTSPAPSPTPAPPTVIVVPVPPRSTPGTAPPPVPVPPSQPAPPGPPVPSGGPPQVGEVPSGPVETGDGTLNAG